jgi:hypothetical protein
LFGLLIESASMLVHLGVGRNAILVHLGHGETVAAESFAKSLARRHVGVVDKSIKS